MLPYKLFIWAGPIAHFGRPLFKSWLKAWMLSELIPLTCSAKPDGCFQKYLQFSFGKNRHHPAWSVDHFIQFRQFRKRKCNFTIRQQKTCTIITLHSRVLIVRLLLTCFTWLATLLYGCSTVWGHHISTGPSTYRYCHFGTMECQVSCNNHWCVQTLM